MLSSVVLLVLRRAPTVTTVTFQTRTIAISAACCWLLLLLLPSSSHAFPANPSPPAFVPAPQRRRHTCGAGGGGGTTTSRGARTRLLLSSESESESASTKPGSLIVVSPPGGVGEVAAVRAAAMGMDVRWFVVSSPPQVGVDNTSGQQQQQQVALSQNSLDEIREGGGSIQLAGADAASLLLPVDDADSAVQAVSSWCGQSAGTDTSILCTYDGMDQVLESSGAAVLRKKDVEDPRIAWKGAIKVAARQASASVKGTKIAVLSATEREKRASSADGDDSKEGGGIGGFVGNLLGGNKADVPASLTAAMGGNRVTKLRHGELFGVPESSPDFSALVGGPRRTPELCEEYTMRSVRVDPTLSVSGNLMMGSNTRSSRHAVGEAAALLAAGKIPIGAGGLDVCVSSQLGSDPVPLESWEKEFQRVEKMLSSPDGAAPQLFSAEFSSVPDIPRLADWLATKWAPAVLRTYDIAAIRVGERPVSASRVGDSKIEIVWQKLVDFQSVTVGKMIIQVSDAGLVATRSGGGSSKYATVRRRPLAGEDVLVRRLAEAVSQAFEKGLANKVCTSISFFLRVGILNALVYT